MSVIPLLYNTDINYWLFQKRISELEAVERRMGRVSVLVLDEVEALQAQLRSEAARAKTAATEAAKV